jgi:hypothetical protein
MRVRTTLVTLAAVAAVTAVAAPAAADVEVVDDPRGDTQTEDREVSRATDIVRLRGEHANSTVRFRLRVVDLTPGYFVADFPISTPDDFADASIFRRDGQVDVFLSPNGPGSIECDGLRGRLSNRSDTVELRVPRSCLGNPRWIRFGSGTGVVRNGFQDRDDARLDGGFPAFPSALGEQRLFRD